MGLSSWLQNLLAGKKDSSARPARDDFVQLYLNRLEDRRVLSADFALVGNTFVLDNFTAGESLTVRDAGANYEFELAAGEAWTDQGGGGLGTATDEVLSIAKTDLDGLAGGLQIVNPADDLSITFETSDFSGMTGLFDVDGAGAISQIAATTVQISTFDVDAASLSLDQTGNDFGSVTIDVSAGANLQDDNGLTLNSVSTGDALQVAIGAGSITLAGNINTDAAAVAGNVTLTGDIVLAADVAIDTDAATTDGTFTVNGAIDGTGHSLTVNVGSNPLVLLNPLNDFGTLGVTADSASIADANSLILSDVNVASSFSLDVASGQSTQAAGTTISGGMSLTTVGAGTLVLSEANTYTGGTVLNAGTLLVNNVSGSGTENIAVNTGTMLGGTGSVTGMVSVNAGGTLSPGTSPGIMSTGNLNFADDSTFTVELADNNASGAIAGTDYDQVQVTGTVTIGTNVALDLQDLSSTQINAGDAYMIINNDGNDAVVGEFAGLAQGAMLTIGGLSARINYHGGDGNDVVLEVEGPFTFANTGGGNVAVRQNTTNGTIEIVKGGLVVDSRLAAGVTEITILGDAAQSDTLTVDYGFDGFFTQMVSFDGGTGSVDTLIVDGGMFGRAEHTFTGSDSGGLLYDVDGDTLTTADQAAIAYTGLEPVDMTGSTITDLVFNLPGADDQAILEDDGTAANGISQIRSQNGTFETTTFSNPTGSLTVNLGGDAATFTVDVLPDFTAELTIDGQAGADIVEFNGDLNLVSGTGDLTVSNVADVNFAAGTDINAVGIVSIAADQSITMTATSTINAGGDVNLTAMNGTVQLAQVQATANTVTVTAGNQITDADLANEGAGNENIIAGSIVLTAVNGIGSGTGVFGEGEDIDINGDTLTATNTGNNSIQIFEVDSNALDQVSNPTRTVVIEAGTGAITDADAGDDTNPNIIAGTAGLMAATGIGSDANPDDDIDLNVDTVAAVTDSGDINLDEADDLTIGMVGGVIGLTITNADATMTGDDDITVLAGGELTVNNAIANNDGGDVTLTAENDLFVNADIDAFALGNITLEGQNVTIAGAVVEIVGTGTIATVDPRNGPLTGTGILTVVAPGTTTLGAGSTLRTGGGVIQITTDDIDINAAASIEADAANNGVVIIRNFTDGRNIELGGSTLAGVLGITDAELDVIQADSLRIGRLTATNDAGDITFTAAFTADSARLQTVQLFAGGDVTQANAAASFQAMNIGIETDGSVAMTTAANDATILATLAAGSIQFRDLDDLTVGTINDAVDAAEGQNAIGVQSANSFVELITDGGNLIVSDTSQANDIFAGGVNSANNLAISLTAAGAETSIIIDPLANVQSLAGAHRYTADNMDIQGTITATGQAVNLRNANAGVAIDLGDNTDTTLATLELSNAELNQVTATLLAIGRRTGNTTANIVVTQTINPFDTDTNTLHLLTTGTVTDAPGGAITDANNAAVGALLVIESTGDAILDNGLHDVDGLVASITGAGSSLTFRDLDRLLVSTGNYLTVTSDAAEQVGIGILSGINTNGRSLANTGGDILLETNGDLSIGNSINSTADDLGRNSGSITLRGLVGGAIITVNALIDSSGTTIGGNGEGGDVTLESAFNIIVIGNINAVGGNSLVDGGNITITSGGSGNVLVSGPLTTNDANDGNVRGSITITAGDSVTLNDALSTTNAANDGLGTVTITANNSPPDGFSSGRIRMNSGGSITADNGDVLLQTLDDGDPIENDASIDTNQITTNNGDIEINANDRNAVIEVFGVIMSNGNGSLLIEADDSIMFASTGMVVLLGSGSATVRANAVDTDGAGADNLIMADGSQVSANTGTITLRTDGNNGGDIWVSRIVTNNTTAAAITINSGSAVLDRGDAGGLPDIEAIGGPASTINITSVTGVGTGTAIETSGVRFNVNNTGNGPINIINTVDNLAVVIDRLTTTGDAITFNNIDPDGLTPGLLTIANLGVSSTSDDQLDNDITITTMGDLTVAATLNTKGGSGLSGGSFTQIGGVTFAPITPNAAIQLGTGDITLQSGAADILINTDVIIDGGPANFYAPRDIIVSGRLETTAPNGDLLLSADNSGPLSGNVADGIGGVLVRNIGEVVSSGTLTLEGSDLAADGTANLIQNGVEVERDGNQVQLTATGDVTLRNRPGFGASDIVFGGVFGSQTGNVLIDANDSIFIADDTTITASGNVTFGDPVLDDGGPGTPSNLVVNSSGITTFFGRVDGIDSLVTSAPGQTHIRGGLVNTVGSQTYNDAVFINADAPPLNTTIAAGGDVNFNSTVDGLGPGASDDLILNVTGTTTFSGAVGGSERIGDGTGHAITINSAGETIFNNLSPVFTQSGILQDNAAGRVTFNANVDMGMGDSESEFRANVTLNGMTLFSNGNVTIGNGAPNSDQLLIAAGSVLDTSSQSRNITINSRVVDPFPGPSQDLTLNLGTGNLTVSGSVGDAGNRFGDFVIVNANDFLFGPTRTQVLFAESLVQQTGSGLTRLNSTVDTLDPEGEGVTIATANVMYDAPVITNGQRALTQASENIIYTTLSSLSTAGGMVVSDASGSILMLEEPGFVATIDADGGMVVMRSVGNLTVSQIRSLGGYVALTSTAGSVIDAGNEFSLGGTSDIQARDLRIAAGQGIGTTGPNVTLETAVSNLEAANGSNGISIFNTGDLVIGGIGNQGAATIRNGVSTGIGLPTLDGLFTASGNLDIAVLGSMTVTEDIVNASDNINLRTIGPIGNFTLVRTTEAADTDSPGVTNIQAADGQVVVAAAGTIDFNETSGGIVQSATGTINAVDRRPPFQSMVRNVITSPIDADFVAALTFTVGNLGESNFTAIVDWGDGTVTVASGLQGGTTSTLDHQYTGPPDPSNPGGPIQVILVAVTDPNIHFFGNNNNTLFAPGQSPLQTGPALPQPGQAAIGGLLDPPVPGLLFVNNVNQGGDFLDFALGPIDRFTGMPFAGAIDSLDVVTVFSVFEVPLNPIQTAAIIENEEVPPIFLPSTTVEAPPIENEEFRDEADTLEFSGSDAEGQGEDEVIVLLRVLSPTGRVLYEYEIETRYLANPEPLWQQLRDGRYQIVIEEPGRSIPIVVRDVELRDHRVIRRFEQNRRGRGDEMGQIERLGRPQWFSQIERNAHGRSEEAIGLPEEFPEESGRDDQVWEDWRIRPQSTRALLPAEPESEPGEDPPVAVAASAGVAMGMLVGRNPEAADRRMARFTSRALSPAARLRRRLRK